MKRTYYWTKTLYEIYSFMLRWNCSVGAKDFCGDVDSFNYSLFAVYYFLSLLFLFSFLNKDIDRLAASIIKSNLVVNMKKSKTQRILFGTCRNLLAICENIKGLNAWKLMVSMLTRQDITNMLVWKFVRIWSLQTLWKTQSGITYTNTP